MAYPSSYKPEYCQMLIDHMGENTYGSFGAVINCSVRAMQRWEKRHPEWLEAKEIGHAHLELYLMNVGKRNLERPKDDEVVFNSTVWCMLVKNCLKWRSEPKDEDADDSAEVSAEPVSKEDRLKLVRQAREGK